MGVKISVLVYPVAVVQNRADKFLMRQFHFDYEYSIFVESV